MKQRDDQRDPVAGNDAQIAPARQYHVGTLVYGRGDLPRLFFWLLLGDFCLSVMQTALPTLLPLQLSARGVSIGTIGWVLSLGPLVAVVFSPFIGVWSDRLRTRWGRRRPFLLISTPIMAAGMLLIPHIRNLLLMQLAVTVVQVANVLQTVLLYLYADVLPPSLMGRFMGAFRFIGVLGTLAFQYFLLPRFGTSPTMVWTVCGLFYLVFFQLSLHNVREGHYAVPEPVQVPKMLRSYVKEGAGSWYIWCLWGALGTVALATPAGLFYNLLSKNMLKLSMPTIATMNVMATIPSLFVMLPGGWLIDRFGPRKLWGIFSLLSGLATFSAYFWVHDRNTMMIFMVLSSTLGSFMGVALMPMLYAHLPRDRFGQLVSMQSVIMQGLIFLSTNIVGQAISLFHGNYLVVFLYGGTFLIFTPIFLPLLGRAKNPFAGEATALCKENVLC